MTQESKYCSDVMKEHFSKELVMYKEDNEDLENPTKCSICDDDYFDIDAKVRDNCHITEKYRDSVHRDCNINAKLNYKIRVAFYNLKKL